MKSPGILECRKLKLRSLFVIVGTVAMASSWGPRAQASADYITVSWIENTYTEIVPFFSTGLDEYRAKGDMYSVELRADGSTSVPQLISRNGTFTFELVVDQDYPETKAYGDAWASLEGIYFVESKNIDTPKRSWSLFFGDNFEYELLWQGNHYGFDKRFWKITVKSGGGSVSASSVVIRTKLNQDIKKLLKKAKKASKKGKREKVRKLFRKIKKLRARIAALS